MPTILPPVSAGLFVLGCFLAVTGCGCHETAAPVIQHEGPKPAPRSTPPAFPGVKSGQVTAAAEETVPRNLSFVDVAQERGLSYLWPEQPRPMTALDAFGAGCAAFDADNDGWQDVLLVGSPSPVLFHNSGGGRFQEVTDDSGLTVVKGHWTG